MRLDRDRDDEHDQQHQHHVDQRRGVDVHHHVVFAAAPTFIAILLLPSSGAGTGRRLGDEAHLEDAGALAGHHQAAHRFVAHLGRRGCAPRAAAPSRLRSSARLTRASLSGMRCGAPVDVAVAVDGQHDVLGLGLRGMLRSLGSSSLIALGDHRHRDQEDDQQHQHHVHQGRGVDGVVESALRRCRRGLRCHGTFMAMGAPRTAPGRGSLALRGPGDQRLPAISTLWRSPAKARVGPSRPCCGGSASCSPSPRARRRPGRWRS
jgi:hypothetical protein